MSGYTRDQPVWWQHRKNDPVKAVFVAYRTKQVIIDVLYTDGSKQRKHVSLVEIQPREEIQEGKEEPTKQDRKQPIEKPQWNNQQLAMLGEIFGEGFVDFYKAHYDENGNRRPADQRPQIPGLRPPPQQEGQQEE